MAIDVKEVAEKVVNLLGKGVELLEKKIPIGEKIINAVLPTLPGIEKDLAKAIVDAADGDDIGAIEAAIVLVADIKASVAAAEAAAKA